MGKAIAATARARATVGGTLSTSNLVRSARAAYETFYPSHISDRHEVVPALPLGTQYVQAAAGAGHTVLLRIDGVAVVAQKRTL